MKPENKIPVLTRLSDEMTAVVNFQQPDLPPWPADGDIETQRQYYLLERRFWNADAPSMTTRTCVVPTPYGDVTTRLYSPQPTSQATLYYLHGGGFILGNLDTHDRIMRLLARYTGCTVIGIDYSLSPQARYPQAIEETVAVCSYFSQHADEYSLNVEKIGFAGDSAGAMLALASAEFDPLIDDSRLLHQTLQAHQQPCEYKMYPGTLHAFLHYSRMMTIADDALQDGARFFMARMKTPR
ncbi:alpha/beta hydrolase fold domain-containing protein [Salmonella enterica]|nr:alpha/beta hydrolase fold domain-containing protein [Salmonella enterica]ELX2840926.1 alpha/beta hydrolase fold domain-containing protein [Salmonella enterica]